MTDLRDAARQALEALDLCRDWPGAYDECSQAITTLRAALAEEALQRLTDANQEIEAALEQPEQEPVAWCDIEEDGTIHGLRYWSEPGRREHALYTHPPRREWRGLTEEDIWTLAANCMDSVLGRLHFARAIEATLKERNV